MQELEDYTKKLIKDADDIRSGSLSIAKAGAICKNVNAVIKIDNHRLQRERIIERQARLKQKV